MGQGKKQAIVVVCLLVFAVGVLAWATWGLITNFDRPAEEGNIGDVVDVVPEVSPEMPEASPDLPPEIEVVAPPPTYPLGGPVLIVDGFVDGAIYEDGWIIFCFARRSHPYSTLFVEWISPDGDMGEVLEIPWRSTTVPHIIGFDITEEGHFQFLVRDQGWYTRPGLDVLIHAVYDRAGDVVSAPRVMELDLEARDFDWIQRVLFLPSGDMVLHVIEWDWDMLYILSPDGTLRSEQEVDFGHLAMLRDGRVVFLADGLRVLDPVSGRLGDLISDTAVLEWDTVWDMHAAPLWSEFDLYVDITGRDTYDWIYGYHLDTGALTPILSWGVAGFVPDEVDDIIVILPDRRIAVFREIGSVRIYTELFVFTPEG
ncbi:MAG: hypothetical protein FWE12_03650 [Oscillospiraceae bacterium]|nr:hypothetical protein [Oscillospiraceae bacterium]